MKSRRNRGQTYTPRTRGIRGVYAVCRKLLSCMMGLRGVEPLTSRLSGACPEGGCIAECGEFHRELASRLHRREKGSRPKFTAHAYTPRTRESFPTSTASRTEQVAA